MQSAIGSRGEGCRGRITRGSTSCHVCTSDLRATLGHAQLRVGSTLYGFLCGTYQWAEGYDHWRGPSCFLQGTLCGPKILNMLYIELEVLVVGDYRNLELSSSSTSHFTDWSVRSMVGPRYRHCAL